MIANIETEKVTIPVNSPEDCILEELFAEEGDDVEVGADLCKIQVGVKPPKEKQTAKETTTKPADSKVESNEKVDSSKKVESKSETKAHSKVETMPRIQSEKPTMLESQSATVPQSQTMSRGEYRVPMTRMRSRIAERLKESQNTNASLTTFNEVDMFNLVNLRSEYRELVQKKQNIKLGYMSAFIKASAISLQEIPIVNARVEGNSIIYNEFCDISVAVATPKGLVTPVLRNCESLNFIEIESQLAQLGEKARQNLISIEDMNGGTFTISNGGVFGSMMGTPIINSPQSAILGMHAIKDRPLVINGEIKIRPVMYLALTYDHRIIDGREAVSFLVRIKEILEDPRRILLSL